MRIEELDTPALLIDRQILMDNIERMQRYADRYGVALRPHTKTHKSPVIAQMQKERGAKGIAVAKVGEAEVMAEHGFDDILIANEVVGVQKLCRIAALMKRSCGVLFGVDCPEHVISAESVFAMEGLTAQIAIEIEVGENRSGIIHEQDFLDLLSVIRGCGHVRLRGVFSHDGNSYDAPTVDEACRRSVAAQERTLRFAGLARENGFEIDMVSIGSTPSQANEAEILPGITEIRPGTYPLMDASQGHAVGTLSVCAATVLTTVISRPTDERIVLDVGAKGITMQRRSTGICAVEGLGTVYGHPEVHIDSVYDEHAMIYDRAFRDAVRIGQKIRIIPVHICPVCNLYDKAYLIDGDEVTEELQIAGRGKML